MNHKQFFKPTIWKAIIVIYLLTIPLFCWTIPCSTKWYAYSLIFPLLASIIFMPLAGIPIFLLVIVILYLSDKPDCIKKECKFQTEAEQAESLLKRYVYSLAHDVKKVFWVNLVENHNYGGHPNDYYDNTGLINNPANDGKDWKKLAYYTYKLMVEKLEGSDWNNIQTIQEKGGIYIYKFTKKGEPIWVAWNDNEKPKKVTITLDKDIKGVKITEAVPRYNSGKEVRDYETAFREIKGVISEGYPLQLSFELGDIPVFVEEK